MSPVFLKIVGGILCFFGVLVSIVFWIPGIINRRKLKEILGPKYPMIFFIYGKETTINFAYMLFGYGIVVSHKGFIDLGFSNLISFIFDSVGIVIILIGIAKIIISYMKKYP